MGARLVSLSLSRIRVITKSPPELASINQEALVLTAKATQLFVQHLALYGPSGAQDKKALTCGDLASIPQQSDALQFLTDVLPKKIPASKYLKMLRERQKRRTETRRWAPER